MVSDRLSVWRSCLLVLNHFLDDASIILDKAAVTSIVSLRLDPLISIFGDIPENVNGFWFRENWIDGNKSLIAFTAFLALCLLVNSPLSVVLTSLIAFFASCTLRSAFAFVCGWYPLVNSPWMPNAL